MKELRTEIEIDAPARRVWDVLTDFESLPEWNPFMQRASGELTPGATLEIHLKLPDGMGMTFKPRVLVAEPGRELRWVGSTLFPGIFDGEHIFEIEPVDGGSCRLVQREQFSGVLVWPMLAMIGGKTRRGFEAMNQALKARAEAGPGQ